MTYRHIDLLHVRAWGEVVGAVAPDPRGRAYVFEYDPDWIRRRVELAPGLMPTSRRSKTFAFPGLPEETFRNLPPMLADSVPDRFGNSIIDAYLAREGVRTSAVTALDRLAYVGERGMGALTFHPDTGPSGEPPTPVVLADLVVAARAAVEGRLDEDSERTEALNRLLAVGTSAGGARAKAVIAWDRATGEMRAGNLPVPDGFEQWLLKFDGVGADPQLGDSQQYGRIEYAYSLMARAAGIEMSETHLIEEGGRAHFMTRRFDRDAAGARLHLQSLCALGSLDFNQIGTHDYAAYLMQCDDLELGPDARQEAFRRLVFNMVGSNCDDHTKNFSFLMDRDGQWTLAPAYDVTFAYSPSSVWLAQHLMSVEGKFADVHRADLERFADRFEVPGYRRVIDQVVDAVADWRRFADIAAVDRRYAAEIADRLAQVALA
jgi:serine/threonine-protein kinase HipA